MSLPAETVWLSVSVEHHVEVAGAVGELLIGLDDPEVLICGIMAYRTVDCR